jgi:hypothetical protein
MHPPDLVFNSYSTIFTFFARWRFHLLFSAAYLSGMLLSDCYYRAVNLFFIQIRTPLLGQVFLPQLIRQLTPYPRMPVRWHTCLLPQGEQPLTVASCTLRHRFCISSACPSSLLWVHPTPLNALVWLSHQVIPRLLLSFQLSPATQKRVGSWFNIGEDVKRSPLVTQESFRNHPCHDHPIVHYSAQVSACDGSVTSR